MFDDDVKEEKPKKIEKVNKTEYAKTSSKIQIRNKSRQRITLDFKRTPSIRVLPGETIEITKEQFESQYFKNRAKYFGIKEA